ncbi:MAG: ATP-binding protein [Anaeromyxobacteraceae bacterium]
MSLRARIILVFAAALVFTLGVAAMLAERIAAGALQQSLRDRSVYLASNIADELNLGPRTDAERATRQLGAVLARHRGLRAAQLTLRRAEGVQRFRVTFGEDGPVVARSDEPRVPLPVETAIALVEEEEARMWRVDLPLKDGGGHTFGALRIDASLSGVEEIAASERSTFFLVAGGGSVVLALLFSALLGRLLTRPLASLAGAMEAVQSGAVDPATVPGLDRDDEIGVVARGLSAMLERIRRFNDELQHTVDGAVKDLARNNRELAEVNALLVEARRDVLSKERLAALGQLSGTIAHELGNPLNAISGNVQLLARDPSTPAPVRAQIEVVEREVKRMTGIIRRFLDSARALGPEPMEVDLPALVEETLDLSLPAEARARVAIERSFGPGADRVRTNPMLVRHVLGNLVSNAFDAMAGGGTLRIRTWRAGDELSIAVSDSGAGIAAEDRRRIFEPFYTTKPRGRGTGLGLAISREIASALRGKIEVDSEPGKGSTFVLTFPAPAEAGARGGTDGAVAHPGGR